MKTFIGATAAVECCLTHILELLCRRCTVFNGYIDRPAKIHHNGDIHSFLAGQNIDYAMIDAYFSNGGYTQGICDCIVAWLADADLTEMEVASLLLQDSTLAEYLPVSKIPDRVTIAQPEWLRCFERKMQPAIEKLFNNKDAVWIRHGPEFGGPGKSHRRLFQERLDRWPTHWCRADGIYAVEHDKLPFNYCSKHGAGTPWAKLRGYHILQPELKLVDENSRDHLWCDITYPIEEWVFLLQKPKTYNRFKFTHHENVCMTTTTIVNKLFNISTLLECKLKALNH